MRSVSRRKALGFAIGAAAAGSSGFATRARAASNLSVGALRLASHGATFVALDRQFFAAAGFDVNLRFFEAAQPMAVAIASGDIDFGLTAVTGGLISLAEKGAVRVIGGGLIESPGVPGQVVVASAQAHSAGVVEARHLAGRRFGITQAGSSFHYMGDKVVPPSRGGMSFVPLQKLGSIIAALRVGQIDGWATSPTVVKPLIESKVLYRLADISDFIPDYMITTVFTSRRIAESDKSRVRAFLAAYSRGVDVYNDALVHQTTTGAIRDGVVETIHKYVGADRPLSATISELADGAMMLSKGAALNLASIGDQLAWFKEKSFVPQGISLDQLVQREFVESV